MELIAVILLVLLVLFGEIGLYRRNGLKGCPTAAAFRRRNLPRATPCSL